VTCLRVQLSSCNILLIRHDIVAFHVIVPCPSSLPRSFRGGHRLLQFFITKLGRRKVLENPDLVAPPLPTLPTSLAFPLDYLTVESSTS
jgi:hypothetical protein